ncbi:MAG: cyclopropane-fatty-acyl-phospholipid synthase family protein [Alphaproteobacteria bacterium]
MLLDQVFGRLMTAGSLKVIDANGKSRLYEGAEDGPHLTIRLHDRRLHTRVFLNPELVVGEAYMNGTLTVEDGSIYDFLALAAMNIERAGGSLHPFANFVKSVDKRLRRFYQRNSQLWARKNVAHHYDLSGELYDLFLDEDRQYSCAYFPTGDEDLETAQKLKKQHIAAKLLLEPGQKVLDIGCGWGGMGLYLAGECGADVKGVTLSEEQLKRARARAETAGLAEKARFDLQDYRKVDGRFDRIVSVGMFEHVGVGYYRTYFRKIRDLLTDDGVALVHTIGRFDPPGTTNPWIRKYIFPGGYIPALSEVMKAIEMEGLWVTDVEVLRLHYAMTLRHWRDRFAENREKAAKIYDETFCRMWEFYLAGSEISFRYLGNNNFQIQLARKQDAVPLTRDYITDWERSANRVAGSGATNENIQSEKPASPKKKGA